MLRFTIFLVGLIGAGLLSHAAWLVAPSAGYAVAGLLCLSWSWLAARSVAHTQPQEKS